MDMLDNGNVLISNTKAKLEDILNKIMPNDTFLKKGLKSILHEVKVYRASLYELKVPVSAAIAGVSADRALTYQLLNNGNGYEGNPIAALGMKLFGEIPEMVASGVMYLLCYGGLGKLIEMAVDQTLINNKSFLPKNSLVKAGLYGYAAGEAVISLNNYFVANGIRNPSTYAFQNYLFDVMPALDFLPLAAIMATIGYYYLKSRAHSA